MSWNSLNDKLFGQKFLSSQNPVVAALTAGTMTQTQGVEVLRQYYYLVVTIVQFLTIAMVRIPVEKAKQELRRNLEEELGSRTNGVSHQELLEALLKQELNVEARTEWNETTKSFITNLLLSFNTQSARFVAGMIYALEATACPELLVAGEIINLAAGREVVRMEALKGRQPIDLSVNTLETFLARHTLDFELGHESGLRNTLETFASEDWTEFENGFSHVLSFMEIWWQELARS